MKIRLNIYSIINSLSTQNKKQTGKFDFVCAVAGVHDSKKILVALKSGDFTVRLSEGL